MNAFMRMLQEQREKQFGKVIEKTDEDKPRVAPRPKAKKK